MLVTNNVTRMNNLNMGSFGFTMKQNRPSKHIEFSKKSKEISIKFKDILNDIMEGK